MNRNKRKSQNSFFMLSFLPAIAYWYLEANYPIRIAVIGGLLLSILELSIEYYFTRHFHTLSKLNFGLILFLGGLSLLGDEGIWFKMQPCLTGVTIAVFLFYKLKVGPGLLAEMLIDMDRPMPPLEIMRMMEFHISYLFFSYGIFMGFVTFYLSTDYWIFFKTIGFYIVFVIFMGLEYILLKRKMKTFDMASLNIEESEK